MGRQPHGDAASQCGEPEVPFGSEDDGIAVNRGEPIVAARRRHRAAGREQSEQHGERYRTRHTGSPEQVVTAALKGIASPPVRFVD